MPLSAESSCQPFPASLSDTTRSGILLAEVRLHNFLSFTLFSVLGQHGPGRVKAACRCVFTQRHACPSHVLPVFLAEASSCPSNNRNSNLPTIIGKSAGISKTFANREPGQATYSKGDGGEVDHVSWTWTQAWALIINSLGWSRPQAGMMGQALGSGWKTESLLGLRCQEKGSSLPSLGSTLADSWPGLALIPLLGSMQREPK